MMVSLFNVSDERVKRVVPGRILIRERTPCMSLIKLSWSPSCRPAVSWKVAGLRSTSGAAYCAICAAAEELVFREDVPVDVAKLTCGPVEHMGRCHSSSSILLE